MSHKYVIICPEGEVNSDKDPNGQTETVEVTKYILSDLGGTLFLNP